MKKEIIIGALLLILGFVTGILCRPHHIERVVDIQRDTTFLIDTHIIEKPTLVKRTYYDTLYVAVRDTFHVRDTTYLPLPFEKRMYANDEYYAEVSGYRPSLDYIEVFPKTKIITEKITFEPAKNNIGIGIEAGYVNAFSIPIYLEYTRMLHKNIEIYGQMIYDLPTKQWGAGLGAKVSVGW